MNLNNFQERLNQEILQRGFNYYRENRVMKSYNEDNFIVQGSEDYEVIVKVDETGNITYSACDCPYDFGPICKHEAAVYFKLMEAEYEGEMVGKKKPAVFELLNDLSKEELVEILMDMTKQDPKFGEKLVFKYAKVNEINLLDQCKKLVSSIVKEHKGREGYISRRNAYAFVVAFEELMEKIRDTEDALLAIDIGLLVLDEGMKAFQYVDDSDGDIGYLVDETIGLIGKRAMACNPLDLDLRIEIFNKLLKYGDRRIFEGWENFKLKLLEICEEFSDIEVVRKKYRAKLEKLIKEESDDAYSNYYKESLLQLLWILMVKYDSEEEKASFIQENIHYKFFRQLLINQHMEKKNYERVIDLALEGEKQDQKLRGLVIHWKKERYGAYKELSLQKEQKKLAKELLLSGDFEYYKELKELAQDDTFYNSLINELKAFEGWNAREVYLKIILEENDLEELLHYVKGNLLYLENYADQLAQEYPEDVIEMYQNYIHSSAKSATDRKRYKGVCRIIKKYKKYAGEEKQAELIQQLNTQYARRPAFIDELGKL
ncbi:hypothetical protein [Psychrobacillus sp. BL-248-WT-3]|uniref:SWIM zinc finger family protein n=1 Tax=Psychrobacillus sp. BL-248-WT-3 TaxID=2725306 RepID=UPI00146C45AA|nr:hypothetical protein [Psychrobacillus sp. BL-248-WT-3]NME07544.1 hypothetical protein [Psychrobacillus sp. BL-248-WT-3]